MILIINGMLVETIDIRIPTEKRPYNITVRCITSRLTMDFKATQFKRENPEYINYLNTYVSQAQPCK